MTTQNETTNDKKFEDAFFNMIQAKVNFVAQELIVQFPEIAKNDPRAIGKMAKTIVFTMFEVLAENPELLPEIK